MGIGGWTYQPWRGAFYPPGLPHARELEYAAGRVTAIEINATYYRLQSPASFARWAAAAPPGFVFTVKGSRFCSNRKRLDEGGEAIERFLSQGLTELGDKLGPILWQLMATKPFDPEELGAFLRLLPAAHAGIPLRHAIEARHPSFADPRFAALAREAGVAIVVADTPGCVPVAQPTAGFVYIRLQQASEEQPYGYDDAALNRWARAARAWAAGEGTHPPGDVFLFMINGAKVRAPAAAEALLARLAAYP